MTVMLCAPYILDNLGDAALLNATLGTIKKINPSIKIIVMCNHPENVMEHFNLKAVRWLNWKHLFESIKAVIDSGIIIIGPGGIIEDITGIGIFRGNIPNIFFISFLGFMLRKKIIFYAVGVGPISTKYGKLLTKFIFYLSSLITVRDEGSRKHLLSLGLGRAIYDISDPAVLLELPPTIEPKPLSNNKIKIGISLRPWPSNDKAGNTKTIRELSRCIDYLVDRYNADIYLLPFHYEYDYPIIEAVVRNVSHKDNIKIIAKFNRIEDGLSAIAELDLFIGMRLHSLIFSAMLSKPIFALEYDLKVKYFMASIGQEKNLINIQNICLDIFKEKIDDLISDISNTAVRITEAQERLKNKALIGQQFLRSYLSTYNSYC